MMKASKCLLFVYLFFYTGKTLAIEIATTGYLQALPVYYKNSQSYFEQRGLARLNAEMLINDQSSLVSELRTRLYSGDIIKENSDFYETYSKEQRFLNLSASTYKEESYLFIFDFDRLFFNYDNNQFYFRFGRQRINWSIVHFTNPMDLFNIYSLYEIDHPERPGSDAIRFVYYPHSMSKIDFSINFNHDGKIDVAAVMFGVNYRSHDLQFVAGLYNDKFASGFGLATYLGESVFKSEVMYFKSITERNITNEESFVVVGSLDHMFSNSIYLIFELAFNSLKNIVRNRSDIGANSLSADRPTLSSWQSILQLQYSVTPLTKIGGVLAHYIDQDAYYLSPHLNYSLRQNTDLSLFSQHFMGKSSSYVTGLGNIYGLSLTWNF